MERPDLPPDLSEPCPDLPDVPRPFTGENITIWIDGVINAHAVCKRKNTELIEAYSG